MARTKILIATIKSWNINNALKFKDMVGDQYDINVVSDKKDLNSSTLKKLNPLYIFFPHWSWIIPEEVYSVYECIVFHMTDLPYGRGGSPLQNLILNKMYKTKISAIKVEKDLDSGLVYLKRNLIIENGSAEKIYKKASDVIFFKMIPFILKYKPMPKTQQGKIVTFKRRNPSDSDLLKAKINNLRDIYDFIRMLDAEGYPKAFINKNGLKISFSNIHRLNNKLYGKYEITYEK